MSLFAPDSTTLIVLIGLVLFALVAAFLVWTRPRADDKNPLNTSDHSAVTARSVIGDGRSLITVRHGDFEHVLLIGPQSDLLLDSRKLVQKNPEKPAASKIPLPFPPASVLQTAYAPPPPKPQTVEPRFEPAPTPQIAVPQQQFVAPPPQPQPAPAPQPVAIEQPVRVEPAPGYAPPQPAYEPVPAQHFQPEPAPAAAQNQAVYDNVFQASVHPQPVSQAPTFRALEPVAVPPPPPAPPPPAPPAREPDIAIPAFLQSKINPLMMEQALPPAEAMPPNWPETPEPEIALANWENTLPPLRAQEERPASADQTLDLAARQLEDALRQKLAEAHLKQPEMPRQNEMPNLGISQPVGGEMTPPKAAVPQAVSTPLIDHAAPATQTSAEAAADRFEQEIRKLLGRDLKKL